MSIRSYLIKTFAEYYKPPQPHRYQLKLGALFAEAWALSRGHRWRFWVANYIVVAFSFVPIIGPALAVRFPTMMLVTHMPVIPLQLAAVMTATMPYFYMVFVNVPLQLGLFLIAASIVYQKPYRVGSSLAHYFRFFWLSNVIKMVLVLCFVIGVPIIFLLSKLVLITFKGEPLAADILFYIVGALMSGLGAYYFSACLLLFIGRVSVMSGVKAVLAAVSQHFWKIWLLFILQCALGYLSWRSWHIIDLVTTPFSYLVWLVLYKKMFANACHIA